MKSPKKPKPKPIDPLVKIRAAETKILYRAVASRDSKSHFGGQPLETWAGELWGLCHTITKKILPGVQTEKNMRTMMHTVVLGMARGIRERL